MTTSVSACATKRSSSTSLLSTIQRWAASKVRCISTSSSSGTRTQPGLQVCRSRWIKGRPVFAASWRENVLFPAPAMPVTTTRLVMALRLDSSRTPASTASVWQLYPLAPETTGGLNNARTVAAPAARRPLDFGISTRLRAPASPQGRAKFHRALSMQSGRTF